MKNYNKLYTREFENFDETCPLNEYPFPQFKRDSYICLNGIWKHKVTKDLNDLNNIDKPEGPRHLHRIPRLSEAPREVP